MSDFLRWPFQKREDTAEEHPPEPDLTPVPTTGEAAARGASPSVPAESESTRFSMLEARVTSLEASVATAAAALDEARSRLERAAGEMETARAHRGAAEANFTSEKARRGLFEKAWATAPLPLRIAFTQGLLSETHTLRTALQEAAELIELWGKGREFEAWIASYPALFADACVRAFPPSGAEEGSEAEALALETLENARALLDGNLRALGVEWITPQPGEPVTDAHAVVGEESEPGIPPGGIARLARPGFRWRGQVYLPAQVVRTGGQGSEVSGQGSEVRGQGSGIGVQGSGFRVQERRTSGEEEAGSSKLLPSSPQPPAPSPQRPEGPSAPSPQPPALSPQLPEGPEWLRTLQRRSAGGGGHTLAEIMQSLGRLAEEAVQDGETGNEELRTLLQPLLPLMGTGGGGRALDLPGDWMEAFSSIRQDVRSWLSSRFGVEVVAPSERSLFVPGVMESAGERRTAHPHEAGTVARVERVGLLRNGQLLVPAQVVRYETGEDW